MIGNFSTGKKEARPKCLDCDAILNHKSQGVRCQICWSRLHVLEATNLIRHRIAAWRPVEPTDNSSSKHWTPAAVECLVSQRNCLTCGIQKVHDISHTNGCYMPSAVQALIDRATPVPQKYAQAILETE